MRAEVIDKAVHRLPHCGQFPHVGQHEILVQRHFRVLILRQIVVVLCSHAVEVGAHLALEVLPLNDVLERCQQVFVTAASVGMT